MTTTYIRFEKNEPPRYYGYEKYQKGGYSTVTQCKECQIVGLYEDCHVVKPCKHCGGKVEVCGAGKWINPKFRSPPKWKFWLTPKFVETGYWQIVNYDNNVINYCRGEKLPMFKLLESNHVNKS